ncbi:MAG: SRPBCC family protein [Actinomycetota bacterium]|nr:SRPBCC family protein [Actinomycetota bacterium]
MPRTSRTRTVACDPAEIWAVVADPHHFPRWWPRVERVEAVDGGRWTKVFMTRKGRPVRADFEVLESREPAVRAWRQELEDSPFERVLGDAVTEVHIEPAGAGAEVTISQRQKLRGMARLGGLLVRRATGRVLDEALDGLERACVR